MQEVIHRTLNGEAEAFREIVKHYAPSVRALLGSHLIDLDVIDDLAQETFLAAYENLANYNQTGDLGSWIRGIARNKMNMYFRHVYKHAKAIECIRAEVSQEFQDEVESDEMDMDQSLNNLKSCFDRLPDKLRDVIHKRYHERESVRMLAKKSHRSIKAVSSLLFRGRKKLRACMEASR